MKNGMTHERRVARGRGFSLIEVALSTAIIGLGVSALMVSVGSGTRVNEGAQKTTQASFLAGEVREWASNLPYDTLAGFASPVTYDPPRDGNGNAITGMTGWSQKVTITWLNPADIAAPSNVATDVTNVQVQVLHNGAEQLSASFLVARRN